MAVCKHDNTVELVEVECKPPPMPTCSNNLTPVRVMDPDGCCWHWECDCKPAQPGPPPCPLSPPPAPLPAFPLPGRLQAQGGLDG